MDSSSHSGQTNLLHSACVDGSCEDISRVIMNSNINAMNVNGLSSLHLCVFRSDNMLKAMKLLCENGANINAKTLYEGDTVLHLLVRNVTLAKAEEAVMELLQMGADPSITNKFTRSPADEALIRNYRYLSDLLGNRIALQKFAEEHKKYRSEYYGELLIEAIRKGDDKEIKLLAQKADINYRNKEGDTALNLLLKQGKLRENGEMSELAELLVNAGADPYLKDVDGWDAFKLASENDYQDILCMIQAFMQKKAGDTAFEMALRECGKSELQAVMASKDEKARSTCTIS